jgi:hypothetical protein
LLVQPTSWPRALDLLAAYHYWPIPTRSYTLSVRAIPILR